MRNCSTCNKDFMPSSGHKSCPSCRELDRKKPCPNCGAPMRPKSLLCNLCVDRSGSNNPRWIGGKIEHRGYIMVRCPEHPRAKANNGYVFEHILVMEDHLGRKLIEQENVHHKNGQKTDNRLENLELWSRSQPSGQRVEDKIKWAKEILALYET